VQLRTTCFGLVRAATIIEETSQPFAIDRVCWDSGRVATGAGRRLMPRVRRRILFSGRVQGVGFRATCHTLARGFDVAGHVRNLPDGRVELVVEGERSEIDAFVTAIQREMSRYIATMTTDDEPPGDDSLIGFSIRY
jgi:acylphosphatase